MFSGLSIAHKLRLITALVLVAVAGLGGSAIYFAAQTKTTAHLLMEDGVLGTAAASRLALLLQRHSSLVRSAPAELDRARIGVTRDSVIALNRLLRMELGTARPGPAVSRQSWDTMVQCLESELPALFDTADRVLALAYNFVQDQALDLSQGLYAGISDGAMEHLTAWRDTQNQTMQLQLGELERSSDVLALWTTVATGIVLLVGLLGYVVVSGVLRRLWRVRYAMDRLADSDDTVEVPCRADPDEIGAIAEAVQVFKDRTGQLFAQDIQLRDTNIRFEAALSNMSQGLCLYDSNGRLTIFNVQFAEMYRLDPAHIHTGMAVRDLIALKVEAGNHPGRTVAELATERQAFIDRKQPGILLETPRDGTVIAISHEPMAGGGWVSTYEDISARKAVEAQIVHMARHDGLTALPNRTVLNERLEQALAKAGRGIGTAVLCLDLDHFKAVNDTLGHAVGDKLLQAVAERLVACIREGDTVARLGGDEFAVLQSGTHRPEEAKLLAERIIAAVSAPYCLHGHQIVIGISVGLALMPADGATPGAVLRSADTALYSAKADGRGGFCFFQPEMDARLQKRRTLELDLREGFATHQFELFYQPIVNVRTGTVSGFEALLRWHHPTRGMVSPAEFIPVVEEIGLITPLGEWIIARACSDATHWPGATKVAVNLSAIQFKSANLVPNVVACLADTGLAPGRLELEITESVLLNDNDSTLATLHELRALGVRIAMDDFGTGYSSLGYLRSFPFDKIKIDQSFIRDLTTHADSIHIVRAVIGLCAGLNMTTTAEGVETQDQLDQLCAEGCTEIQGYLFGRPAPAAAVGQTIRTIHAEARWRGSQLVH